jgi:hypothetical protein
LCLKPERNQCIAENHRKDSNKQTHTSKLSMSSVTSGSSLNSASTVTTKSRSSTSNSCATFHHITSHSSPQCNTSNHGTHTRVLKSCAICTRTEPKGGMGRGGVLCEYQPMKTTRLLFFPLFFVLLTTPPFHTFHSATLVTDASKHLENLTLRL